MRLHAVVVLLQIDVHHCQQDLTKHKPQHVHSKSLEVTSAYGTLYDNLERLTREELHKIIDIS